MNKQELIERYKTKYAEEPKDWKHPSVNASRQDLFANFIRDLERLDEPQKPVVPKFVAEWLEKMRKQLVSYHFESGARFMMFIGIDYHQRRGLLTLNEKVRRWLEKDGNEVKLSNAIDYGYEVEQEPLYMVPLLTDKEGNKKILVERRGEYDIIWDYKNEGDWHELLTEEQIKSVNPDYWKLAVLYEPSEEVAEG